MSASSVTRLDFGGEERDFAFRLSELRRLQELTGRGPHRVLTDLRNGDWQIDDPRHVIRLGLEAAGVEPKEAGALVKRYLDERGAWLSEGRTIAISILINGLEAPDDDPPGKSQAKAETAKA